jgi:hypothetical protein
MQKHCRTLTPTQFFYIESAMAMDIHGNMGGNSISVTKIAIHVFVPKNLTRHILEQDLLKLAMQINS